MSTGDGQIAALFLDVGGVLLTNGWDRNARRRAAETFGLDHDEMDERHHLTYDTYEVGKLSLAAYLQRLVFYEPRQFTRDQFREFMFAQSQPFPAMLQLVQELKSRHRLKLAVVSNEGRELAEYRVKKFGLARFIDFFIFSSFVHYRKPDSDIFRVALDVAQVPTEQVVYLEDRSLFVEVASGLGIRGLRHEGYESTRAAMAALGLTSE